MSSALNYDSLSYLDSYRFNDIKLTVVLKTKDSEHKGQFYTDPDARLTPRQHARRLHLMVVQSVVPCILSAAKWRRDMGPRLLNRAIVSTYKVAHVAKDAGIVLYIDTTVATDSVAYCWGFSETTAEAIK